MVPLEILPMVPLVDNGTIGNQRTLNVSRQPMVPLVPIFLLVKNGTIGKPNGVNSNIMIDTSNLFLYSYFVYVYISEFLLFANIILITTVFICEIYKCKV